MDGPYAGYKDAAGFERSCRIARAMGFDGKQCIHPAQMATANAIFSPTAEEVAHARTRSWRLTKRAVAEGRGCGQLEWQDDRRGQYPHGANHFGEAEMRDATKISKWAS